MLMSRLGSERPPENMQKRKKKINFIMNLKNNLKFKNNFMHISKHYLGYQNKVIYITNTLQLQVRLNYIKNYLEKP